MKIDKKSNIVESHLKDQRILLRRAPLEEVLSLLGGAFLLK